MQYEKMTDEQLCERAQAGDIAAIDVLIER